MIILSKKNYMFISLFFLTLLTINVFVGAFIMHYEINDIWAVIYILLSSIGVLYFTSKYTDNFKNGIRVANFSFLILVVLFTIHCILLHFYSDHKVVRYIDSYMLFTPLFLIFHPIFFIISDIHQRSNSINEKKT